MDSSLDVHKSTRILSIQSHVVSGYCGNKSATFPLQLIGFEVDVLNSVQLSNHTQYKTVKGQIFKREDIEDIHFGLKANQLLRLYDHVISGYVADVGYIESMANLISDIKQERQQNGSDCWYTFDPVLGDIDTGFYVPDGRIILESYLKMLVPLADIITPNLFEVCALTGREIDASSPDALKESLKGIQDLHAMGIKIVALTSVETNTKEDQLVCILSCAPESGQPKQSRLKPEAWMIRIPKINCPFYGTGDLFSALLTGWFNKTDFDMKTSLENTASTIHHILEDTHSWSKTMDSQYPLSIELRIIQNQAHILSPKCLFSAQKIDLDDFGSIS